jgi:hypothetical protein
MGAAFLMRKLIPVQLMSPEPKPDLTLALELLQKLRIEESALYVKLGWGEEVYFIGHAG